MTKNTIEFSEQPLHDRLTQMFIKNFLEKQAVRDALNDRDMDKLEELIAEEKNTLEVS